MAKILIDARLYGLENAGLGRYTLNLIQELVKIDQNNNYVVLLRKKYFDSLIFPENWKKVLTNFKHYSFSEQIKLKKIIESEAPDLVHFPHFNVPIFYKGKYIVTIHDLLMHRQSGLSATTLIPPLYFLKRIAYKTIFRKAVTGASKIIVPSNAVRKEVEDYYKLNTKKTETIYEGVDEKIEGKENPEKVLEKYKINEKYFLYVGNAYPHKNLKRAIEAIILLNKESDQKVILAIASSRNIFTQRLQKLIKKLGGGEFVKLLGFVPDSDLGILYKNSVAFVFPSLSEGFGLPGLEAMSLDCPVLASDIPVFREIYKDNVIYFNPYDFSAMETAMKNIIKMDNEERNARKQKAKEFAKIYSWSKMAKETLAIYEQESSNSLRSGK
jgi:glycosyltransferase involved in cell wall biosynthesis